MIFDNLNFLQLFSISFVILCFFAGFGDMKPHNQAMGGTLDAIRERMKSIQAGATGTAVSHTSNFSSNGSMSHSRSSSSGDVGEDKALSGLQARMERLKAGGGLEFEITQR